MIFLFDRGRGRPDLVQAQAPLRYSVAIGLRFSCQLISRSRLPAISGSDAPGRIGSAPRLPAIRFLAARAEKWHNFPFREARRDLFLPTAGTGNAWKTPPPPGNIAVAIARNAHVDIFSPDVVCWFRLLVDLLGGQRLLFTHVVARLVPFPATVLTIASP